MAPLRITFPLIFLFTSDMLHAEVVDKLASVPQLWGANAILASVFFVAAFFASRSLGLFAVIFGSAILLVLPLGIESEFLSEAIHVFGPSYEVHAIASQLLIPLGAVLGAACAWWRKKKNNI